MLVIIWRKPEQWGAKDKQPRKHAVSVGETVNFHGESHKVVRSDDKGVTIENKRGQRVAMTQEQAGNRKAAGWFKAVVDDDVEKARTPGAKDKQPRKRGLTPGLKSALDRTYPKLPERPRDEDQPDYQQRSEMAHKQVQEEMARQKAEHVGPSKEFSKFADKHPGRAKRMFGVGTGH
jgi:hypothetical protein